MLKVSIPISTISGKTLQSLLLLFWDIRALWLNRQTTGHFTTEDGAIASTKIYAQKVHSSLSLPLQNILLHSITSLKLTTWSTLYHSKNIFPVFLWKWPNRNKILQFFVEQPGPSALPKLLQDHTDDVEVRWDSDRGPFVTVAPKKGQTLYC